MKSATKIVSFFLLVVVLVHSEEEMVDDGNAAQCIKERRRGLVSIKKKLASCDIAVTTSTPDPQDVTSCIAKCAFKQENALDDNDAITRESFETAIENRVSGPRRERLIKAFDQCHEEHGYLVVGEDPTCPGYLSLGHCLHKAIESLCEDPEALSPRPAEEDPKDEL
ncbi:unnamed protein product [Allacma fusca]|uniref:Uncharacterized protein n=1 Tax=Allacma fusca TaxID=39272 RepID=A0A8J2PCZ1_9HEXA|nr:unnamed protein product [Allacma fusca]